MKPTSLAIGTAFLTSVIMSPALAVGIADPQISGGGGYILYDSDGTNTYVNSGASLIDILTGDASSPTGNVELFSDSESDGFTSGNPVILEGTLNGKSILLSSLTEDDWLSGGFAAEWFDAFLDEALNFTGQAIRGMIGDTALYSTFVSQGGREIFSDPNISYVNLADDTISIGLAGHLNAYERVVSQLPFLSPYLSGNFQASEIVKVIYDGGPASYLYSFYATDSGLVEEGDKTSHSGNYEVVLHPQPVPEPATVAALGLVGLVGGIALRKKSALS